MGAGYCLMTPRGGGGGSPNQPIHPPTSEKFSPANRQPLLTAINHQSPTTNRRQPPVANRQPPTANTWCACGLFWENFVTEPFLFPLRTALVSAISL